MATSTKSPGTIDASGSTIGAGNGAWSDNGAAAATDNGSGTIASLEADRESFDLLCTNFGFDADVPASAIINSITIKAKRRTGAGAGAVGDAFFQLWDGSALIGDNMNGGGAWTESYVVNSQVVTGTLPNAAVVRSSGFGVVLVASETTGTGTQDADVDYISIVVDYTAGRAENAGRVAGTGARATRAFPRGRSI